MTAAHTPMAQTAGASAAVGGHGASPAPLAQAAHSRFVQRIRRRYGDQLA